MKNNALTVILIVFTVFLSHTQEKNHTLELSVENIWKQYQFFGRSVEGFNSLKDGEHYTRFEHVNGQKSIVKYAFKDLDATPTVILDEIGRASCRERV